MKHQVDVHGLIDRRTIIDRHLYGEVLVRIDRDRDWELVHWHVLTSTSSGTVHAVGSGADDWVHFRNRDQRKEDDILVNDSELQIRTTTNDFSIASTISRVLVRMQE